MLVSNDKFITELARYFERTKLKGSIFVTSKRLIDRKKKKGETETKEAASSYRCLYRATSGKKKISTVIEPHAFPSFQSKYMALLRNQMTSLKKPDKAKKRSGKAAAAKSSAAATASPAGASSSSPAAATVAASS